MLVPRSVDASIKDTPWYFDFDLKAKSPNAQALHLLCGNVLVPPPEIVDNSTEKKALASWSAALTPLTCPAQELGYFGGPKAQNTFDSHSHQTIEQLEKDGSRIIQIVKKRIVEREELLSQIGDTVSSKEDIKRAKILRESENLQEAWTEWNKTRELLQETIPLLNDPDPVMRSLAADEYSSLATTFSEHISTVFPSLLTPVSPTANLSALMELKSGVGGSEASLFLTNLLRMYQRYAHTMRWKVNIVASNENEGGGTKDAVIEFEGKGAYDALRWESGVHRVQRVPATEASGRVHTSTVAIVVLPLVEEKESEELFSMADVKVEVMRARGAGGQHVNKTESAVRLTHIPSGITVSMQDERSQHQNKRRAFQVLSARLMDAKLIRDVAARRDTRRNLVHGADRSEKIRTYNYPQDRVTDHRIGMSTTNLTSVMEGEGLQEFIEALQKHHHESIMENMLDGS
ncbi:hypothetical protein EYR38_008918 [Pleurotus pulmonarius]|nr:hypothetical protein EYR38_008918 [Pleurotus pulmonarius]